MSPPDPTSRPAALVVGATGLVGGCLVRDLLEGGRYHRVAILTRRPFPDPAIRERLEERIVDFDRLEDRPDAVREDHVFCALGTTMRRAGSRAAFRRVDLGYTRSLARLAGRAGAHHFSMVSAIGASRRSPFFYSRVKAEAERAVIDAGLPGVSILRPSVLGGERDDVRPGERVAQLVLRFVPGRWRLVRAADVARVMVRLALEEAPGVRIVESREIRRLAGRIRDTGSGTSTA